MVALIDHPEDLLQQCQRIFSPGGRLSTALVDFTSREAQVVLALAIAKAITQYSALAAEAGTGTGKTFAYLVPCLLSKKKTIISTATKTLQDQLFSKDLPLLTRALGLSVKMQNLKGRSNYICRHRVLMYMEEGRFSDVHAMQDLIQIHERLPRLETGDRAELTEITEDSPAWTYATSTNDNCLGSECKHYKECFLLKARKKALDADLVVINHHLFFADGQLKEEGFAELLPGAEIIVFDEAHQLPEIATHFNSQHFGTKQLQQLIQEIISAWPVLDLVNRPFKQLSIDLDKTIDRLLLSFPSDEERSAWSRLLGEKKFLLAWQEFLEQVNHFLDNIEESVVTGNELLPALVQQLKEYIIAIEQFNTRQPLMIQWVEKFRHSMLFHITPVEVEENFKKIFYRQKASFIFTSATLTVSSSFDYFLKPLGLKEIDKLIVPSPFDYQKQALLYLPRGLPDPRHLDYYELLVKRVISIIKACGGRTFFLFTSHSALKKVAHLLSNTLHYPLLIQGEEAKPILLARFRSLEHAVLLGTSTFWEGVDVKGSLLSCVIIDKLPFASPKDPVVQGKMSYLKAQGCSPFDDLSLPQAIIALKQGIGRLIRDISDQGVLVIADPRLTGRAYGREIFASLPLISKTRNEETVLQFIKNLALEHETTCN